MSYVADYELREYSEIEKKIAKWPYDAVPWLSPILIVSALGAAYQHQSFMAGFLSFPAIYVTGLLIERWRLVRRMDSIWRVVEGRGIPFHAALMEWRRKTTAEDEVSRPSTPPSHPPSSGTDP